jgi:tetratricopeptide (TPR) repeat protein
MGRKLSIIPEDDHDDLIKRYESFMTKAGSNGYFDVEELEHIVDYYLRKGKTDAGSGALDFGFRIHPGNPQLFIKKAKIYLSEGKAKEALRILEQYPVTSEYEVLLLKTEALVQSDRTDEAIEFCNQIIIQSNNDLDIFCLDLAYIFLARLEIETAYHFLVAGEKYNPENTDLLYELAFCCEQVNKPDESIRVYKKIIDLDPFSHEAWFNLGQILFSGHNFTAALDAYEYAMAILPEDALCCLQKAHCNFQLNNYKDALEDYAEYQALTESDWQVHLFIGECYERLERFEESIVSYKKSLELNPENFEALTGIGICLLEQEKYSESLEFIKEAIVLNSDASDVWVYYAEGLTGIDDNAGALLAYMKSIELDPDQPDTLMAIANICMENGEYDTAIFYYEQALEKDIDHELENIHLFMAVAFFQTGNDFAWHMALARAKELNPEAERIFYEICNDDVQL